ncbi:GNAT family N-acetyltransferase [Staphylococcus simulans]
MDYFYLPINEDLKLAQPELFMAEPLFQAIEQDRAFLSTYLPFIDHTLKVEDERDFIKLMLKKQAANEQRLFVIYYQNQVVGTIDIHQIDLENKKAFIGYWLQSHYNGLGIMARCLHKICDFAFNTLGLNKLSLHVNTKNKASQKVAERAHFCFVGTDKDESFERGQFEDFHRYALLKHEFNTQISL